jgi:hypothetical protein
LLNPVSAQQDRAQDVTPGEPVKTEKNSASSTKYSKSGRRAKFAN